MKPKPKRLNDNAQPTFWVVWSPQGDNPSRQHFTLKDATTEAERLARGNRYREFIVLQGVASCSVDVMRCIPYRSPKK